MNRKSKQVSLEPYGFTLVRRAPVKSPTVEIKTKAIEPKDPLPAPAPVVVVSPASPLAEVAQTPAPKTGTNWGCLVAVICVALVVLLAGLLTSPNSGTNGSSYSASNYDAG